MNFVKIELTETIYLNSSVENNGSTTTVPAITSNNCHPQLPPYSAPTVLKPVTRSVDRNASPDPQEVNLSVGGYLFLFIQVWKELGLLSFCQEVVSGLETCRESQSTRLGSRHSIEQVFPTQGRFYKASITGFGSSGRVFKIIFYSNMFTVPKPGTNLLRPVLDLKRLYTFIANQAFKMEGIKNYLKWLSKVITWCSLPMEECLSNLDKEECLSNLDKTMELLVKLGFSRIQMDLFAFQLSNDQLLYKYNECTPTR
ncbi:hypothetical protein ACTFIU_005707 [Dictyostelium citrinum]